MGPRYCPSIETKITRFADKPRHQLFLEPMGLDTEEMYLQGFSSAMPEEVQLAMLHTIAGLERAEMMRPLFVSMEGQYRGPTPSITPLCMGERSRFSRIIRWVSSFWRGRR